MIISTLLASLVVGAVYGATRPNIIFFLLDDQDVMLNSLDAMPQTRQLFGENGLKFRNGFSSNPVCCVSRSSMLLGRYIHNHLAQNNTVSGNCYSSDWVDTEEQYAYNNYLHKAGYKTMYSGKYLNNYGREMWDGSSYATIPVGWDEWYTICGDAKFYSYTLSNNGEKETHGTDYDTDFFPKLQQEKALEFLSSREEDEEPFLMVLGTPAAHKPWDAAPEYEYIQDDEDMVAPRTSSWNYMENSDKGAVINSLTEMDDDLIAQSDKIYRMRHAVLLTVDDMVAEVVQKVKDMGQFDNTYFVYTADHGFHVGQYGMTFGKRLLYETDVRVPMYIAGPTVQSGAETSAVAMNIDIAPTFIELALGKDAIPSNMDGRSLVEFFDLSEDEELEIAQSKQAFLIEYNGESPPYDTSSLTMPQFIKQVKANQNSVSEIEIRRQLQEGMPGMEVEQSPQNLWIMNCESQVDGLDGMNCDTWNNTYKCVRVIDGMKDDEDSLSSDQTTWETTMAEHTKGEVYCSYTCFDPGYNEAACMEDSVEYLGEYYDLDVDTWQTVNTMSELSSNIKAEYEDLLTSLKECSGETCRDIRITESTWAKRGSLTLKNQLNVATTTTEHKMSTSSELFIGLMCVLGLSLAYFLYTRAMNKLVVKKIQYSKVATRPNYGGINAPTQAL